MLVFTFILYILLVVLLRVSAMVYLSPILIGLAAVVIANIVSKVKRGKFAPVLWDVLTVCVTILTTGMLWEDIADEAIDTGFLPFAILAIYGMVSLAVLAIPKWGRRPKVCREAIALEELPEKTQKRIRASRIVAIVCSVMTGIGTIIVATGSASIGESLPPTILFGIVAIVCWTIACRKRYVRSAGGEKSPLAVDQTS